TRHRIAVGAAGRQAGLNAPIRRALRGHARAVRRRALSARAALAVAAMSERHPRRAAVVALLDRLVGPATQHARWAAGIVGTGRRIRTVVGAACARRSTSKNQSCCENQINLHVPHSTGLIALTFKPPTYA